jgi:hypothetical protein
MVLAPASLHGLAADTAIPTPNATTLAATKSACNTAVSNREGELSLDVSRISAITSLTPSDKSALLAIESSDASGLTSLNATIQSDSTELATLSDCAKIVTGYYVYVLYDPQLFLVGAADTITAIDGNAASFEKELQTELSGNTNPTVQSALADLSKQVAAAGSSASGVSAKVLSLTPSGYSSEVSVLQSAYASLLSARADLQQASADLTTIRTAL